MSKQSKKYYEKKRKEKERLSQPSKEDKKFQEMVAGCVSRSRARQNDWKERKSESNRYWTEWRKEFLADITPIAERNPDSVSGIGATQSVFNGHWQDKYDDPNLAAREQEAMAKAEALKKRVGSLFNKGGLQLMTSAQDIKDQGKKTSEI